MVTARVDSANRHNGPMVRRRAALALVAAIVIAVAGCAASGGSAGPAATASTVLSSGPATIGIGTVATPTTPTTPGTAASTRVSTITGPRPTATGPMTTRVVPTFPVTVPPTIAGQPTVAPVLPAGTTEIGRSVEGRPITLLRRGTPGGTPVLVIGVIHGNEDAGTAIVDELTTMDVPDGIELFIVPSMNPDGQAADRRTNGHLVDLNRNFPEAWGPLGEPGDGQYAGTGPASEPETEAIVRLVEDIRPAMLIWYHQDLNRIAPAKGRAGRVRQRYAALTGLPIVSITGGTYTGTAAGWARKALPDGVAFIVELGPSITAEQARIHAEAVLTVAGELATI